MSIGIFHSRLKFICFIQFLVLKGNEMETILFMHSFVVSSVFKSTQNCSEE